MAKLNYLEVVEMLGTSVSSAMQKKIDHVVARKKALKEEDSDLDSILDGLLRDLQSGEDE